MTDPSASDAATIAGDTIAADPSRRPERPPDLARPRARGDLVGRYILLTELGAGAMGVVWAAHDPELDRRVALKLLARGDQSERLLREAQALARLAHPNVVAVHDAGVDGGDVWLAMELVSGVTFKTWLKRHTKPPGWRAVLDALLPALRGVAAAHAAGLVHRDLKPDNLMIGDDGRARVMDFGLARAGEALAAASAAPSDDLLTSRSSLLSSDVTRTGALLGTPAYMAPEQLRGAADARSDLFSLCVVLWEALHGARPFGGDTIAATLLAIAETRLRPAPPGARVPRWLRRVLVRGLAPDPAARWPDVGALIAALERGGAQHRRGRLLLGLALVALAGASLLGAAALAHRRDLAACEAAGAAIDEVWPGRADAVAAGLVTSALPYARTTGEKITPLLDAWARRVRDERSAACTAATIDGTLGPELRERAEFCLDNQRTRVVPLLDGLARGDKAAIRQAIPVLSRLSSLPSCLDRAALERGAWPPPEQWPAVRSLRARLVEIGAMQLDGDYERSVAEARALRVEAEALGWPPLLPEFDLAIANTLYKRSSFAEAEPSFRAAFFGAGRAGDDMLAARAASELALLVGHDLRRTAEGLEWGEHAAMLLARLGKEEGLEGGDLLAYLASIRVDAGQLDEALALAQRSLQLRERLLDPQHLDLARTHNALGIVLRNLGRMDDARAHFERHLAIRETTQGPDHPEIPGALNNLALATQDPDAALALYERSIALSEASGDHDSPGIALALGNAQGLYAGQERFAEAQAAGARALEIRERTLGPDHPLVASALNNLALVVYVAGDRTRALELHRRALAIREAKLGPDHPDVARSLTNIAETEVGLGHPEVALPLLERARAIRTARTVAPQDLAYTQYVTAQALAATGEAARARELATTAADVFRLAGDPRVADVDALLARLAADPPAKRPRRPGRPAR